MSYETTSGPVCWKHGTPLNTVCLSGGGSDLYCPLCAKGTFDASGAPATSNDLPMFGAANYLRVGKWSQCLHCKAVFAGDHYCGAPWQSDPGFGIDGVSAEWRAAMPHRDTARLDWLDQDLHVAVVSYSAAAVRCQWPDGHTDELGRGVTLREAIDNARTASQP